jgi:hypothetical protein
VLLEWSFVFTLLLRRDLKFAREVRIFPHCGRRAVFVNSSSDQVKNERDTHEECSTMDGAVTINGGVETAGVTVFEHEACDSVSALGDYIPMTLALPQASLQDIKAYFERPRLLNRGSLTFGSNAVITQTTFGPLNTELKALFPQWSQRLAGAYGIRFTMNFRLQVSVTSFHQGLLALGWQYGLRGGFGAFARYDKSYAITNLPHVRLDLSEQTMVELSIPFMYPNEFLEVEPVPFASNPVASDLGTIALVPVLAALSVAGLTAPTYALYSYLTDIELFGVDVINPTSVVLQSGGGLITKEVKESKIVSGTLSNMAKISRFVARGIPSLSAIAGPASWALDTAAGVARYFGFSKPMVQDPPVKIYRSNYGNEYQVDLPQTGDVVGIIQGNTTTIDTSLGGTDVDEMSLAFLTQQWSQINRNFVATVNTHGTFLYSAPVSPAAFWFRAGNANPFSNIVYPFSDLSLVSNSGNSFLPSSLMYISSFFRYWRGSIKFRFTFAKTKLHGGRYMATFNPSLTFQSEAGNYGANVSGPEIVGGLVQPYGNSAIFDLKDGNVFEFEVPFVSTAPYRTFDSSIGGITLVCMEPLQATATVSTSVPFVVEVCGGEDFELADFLGVRFPLQTNGTVYTQSGGEVRITTKAPSSNTMGERIMSVKQLLQVPSPTVVSLTGNSSTRQYICPWFTNPTFNKVLALTGLPNSNTQATTFVGGNSVAMALSKCYLFAKGGTNVHVYTDRSSNTIRVFQATSLVGNTSQATTNLSKPAFPSSVPTVIQSGGLAVHTRTPTFQSIVRIPTYHLDGVFDSPLVPSNAGVGGSLGQFACLSVVNPDATTSNITVLRSASDDAQLAHYMGPVPVFIPNGLSLTSFDSQNPAYT